VTLEWGGLVRSALVHVPPSYDAAAGAMLVLNFHGFGSDAPQEALLTRMSDASDERGFLVAYPYGVLSSWNAGQCCGTAWADAVDDVGFVRALLDELAERYCVDPRRVFATGMSNGGFLSHRLGCELADRLAAIAPVAGVLGLSSEACQPARPVPVLDIHGTADPLVPYEGGVPLVGWDTGGMIDFPSVAETVDAWRAIDGCGEASEVSYAVGDATCTRWPACAGASEVVACVIDDGGHTWPGGTPIPGLGKTSHDLDATAAMLDFFEAHPMP
jgi:polyhydroxybutyrate depolymerase